MRQQIHAQVLALLLVTGCGGSQPRPEDPEPPPLPPDPGVEEPALVPAPEPAPEPVEEPQEDVAAPLPEEPVMAQPDVEIPLEGTLASKKGKVLAIEIDHPDPPAKDSKGVLYKHFEKQIGSFMTSGWLAIGNVTVTASSQTSLKLRIDEELSVMKVNGKKVDHFVKGTPVKLEIEP